MTSSRINNSRAIMRQAIERSNRNKYNESMHLDTEELTGEPNDRTAADADGQYERGEPLSFNQ